MNNLTTDSEIEVKANLKELSLEELHKLKQKLLDNVCQNGSSRKSDSNIHGFKTIKRKNKNRPSEISSKIDPSLNHIKKVIKVQPTVEKTKKIDPRFDSLYGEFDKRVFERNYKFLNGIKEKEKKKLRKKLKQNGPGEKKQKVKLLLQRIENQDREKQRINVQERIKLEQKLKVSEALKDGKKPQFLKKRELKILQLVGQYEDLKSQGKLNKHIKQKRIRKMGNEKKTLFNDSMQ